MTDPRPRLRVVLATANPDKAKEIAEILGEQVKLVARPAQVPDVEEWAESLVDNARLKALALCQATGLPALADDTGLEVRALHGAPGVYSSRYAGPEASYEDNVVKLLAELAGQGDRRARFRTVALMRSPDGSEVVGEGVVEGSITPAPRGEAGFAYDPVFVPNEGDGRTFAEMSSEEKHEISHRGRALRAIAEQLTLAEA